MSGGYPCAHVWRCTCQGEGICVLMCEDAHVYTCTWMSEAIVRCLQSLFTFFFLNTGSLPEPRALQFGWLANQWAPGSCLCILGVEITGTHHCTQIFHDCWGLNSCPNACMTSVLLNKWYPTPTPNFTHLTSPSLTLPCASLTRGNIFPKLEKSF